MLGRADPDNDEYWKHRRKKGNTLDGFLHGISSTLLRATFHFNVLISTDIRHNIDCHSGVVFNSLLKDIFSKKVTRCLEGFSLLFLVIG